MFYHLYLQVGFTSYNERMPTTAQSYLFYHYITKQKMVCKHIRFSSLRYPHTTIKMFPHLFSSDCNSTEYVFWYFRARCAILGNVAFLWINVGFWSSGSASSEAHEISVETSRTTLKFFKQLSIPISFWKLWKGADIISIFLFWNLVVFVVTPAFRCTNNWTFTSLASSPQLFSARLESRNLYYK